MHQVGKVGARHAARPDRLARAGLGRLARLPPGALVCVELEQGAQVLYGMASVRLRNSVVGRCGFGLGRHAGSERGRREYFHLGTQPEQCGGCP
jgi:hypothetical protein